jgi:peptide/nickel transport system permease protein
MTERAPGRGEVLASSAGAPRATTAAGTASASLPATADVFAPEVVSTVPPLSPRQIFWRQFRRSHLAVVGGALLLVFYTIALFAPFLAPYSQEEMDRDRFFHPPHRLHWVDAGGRFHPIPFVHPTRLADPSDFTYQEDESRVVPIRFFVRGTPYRLFGVLRTDRHLFGVESGERIFLLGADPSGRDVFSRLLFGGQISLTVGLVGIAISFTIGLLLGGISGYFGGWIDTVIMRSTELLLSIPGLYLIIALRGIFPADLPSQQVYLAIVAILAIIGWAGLARIIRGMVLSLRQAEYVTAAEALGMSRLRIIRRHILPNTLSFVIVAATISIPGYILGEVVLSFLGVGVQEPAASWGNMLNQARTPGLMRAFPWLMLAPGAAIFLTVMAFNLLGDGLRDALDPRKLIGAKG